MTNGLGASASRAAAPSEPWGQPGGGVPMASSAQGPHVLPRLPSAVLAPISGIWGRKI